MLKFKFLSAVLSVFMMVSVAGESLAFFTSRDPREADLGVLNQIQIKEKEADIAFSNTKLKIDEVRIIKSGTKTLNNINLVLRLENNGFVEISKGQEAGGWIVGLPKGIDAYVSGNVERGDNRLTLSLKGLSPKNLEDPIIVGLPNAVLCSESKETVKSSVSEEATWNLLSSDYEAVTEEGEVIPNVPDEIFDADVSEIQKDVVSAIKYRGGSYTEVEISTNKYIPAEVLEEIYDYALDAGATKRHLANVCLLFTQENSSGKVDTRMYVPFLRLVESGNGLNPTILMDGEHARIKDISSAFKKQTGKDGQVFSIENKEEFGSDAGIVIMPEGRISSNRYKNLYVLNEENDRFERFSGKYEIDASGYLHFFTENGGYFVLA